MNFVFGVRGCRSRRPDGDAGGGAAIGRGAGRARGVLNRQRAAVAHVDRQASAVAAARRLAQCARRRAIGWRKGGSNSSKYSIY